MPTALEAGWVDRLPVSHGWHLRHLEKYRAAEQRPERLPADRAHRSRLRAGFFRELYELGGNGRRQGFPAPASYTLDVFAVPASITGKQGISLSEIGAAAGSSVILYSCETTATPAGAACSGGDIGATPFTNAGLIDTTSGGGPPPPSPPRRHRSPSRR